MMDSEQTAPTDAPMADPAREVARLQTKLARRLLLIFSVPVLIVLVLGGFAYKLSARLKEVEMLERIAFIERWYKDSANLPWAIDQYQRLLSRHDRPAVLVRLANLYFNRSKVATDSSARGGDVRRAEQMLHRANQLSVKTGHGEYWEALTTLTFLYTDLAVNEQDEARRSSMERQAVQAGELAIALDRFDAQSLNNLAWIYATSSASDVRDLARAEQYARRAVELTARRNADYLDTYAEVARRAGRKAEGQALIREAARVQQPSDPYLLQRAIELGTTAVASKGGGS